MLNQSSWICTILLFLSISYTLGKSYVDRVCKLSKDEGKSCATGKIAKKHYFDVKSEKCVQFTYKGCEGNDNSFDSWDECNDSCGGPYLIQKEKDQEKMGNVNRNKADCLKPHDAGPCKALIQMWFYNPSLKLCMIFTYGGCGGNDNKFDSQSECEKFCRNP